MVLPALPSCRSTALARSRSLALVAVIWPKQLLTITQVDRLFSTSRRVRLVSWLAAQAQAGDTALILGAGGIGAAAPQLVEALACR